MFEDLFNDFKNFLEEYRVIGVGVAFVMGQAINELVRSFTKDILLELLGPIINVENLSSAVFTIGSINLKWGSFLSSLINFFTLTFFVFLFMRFFIKKQDKIIK